MFTVGNPEQEERCQKCHLLRRFTFFLISRCILFTLDKFTTISNHLKNQFIELVVSTFLSLLLTRHGFARGSLGCRKCYRTGYTGESGTSQIMSSVQPSSVHCNNHYYQYCHLQCAIIIIIINIVIFSAL